MMQQLSGTATVLVIVLAYVLIVQSLTAAMVLLAQFIVVQVRTLRALVAIEPKTIPEPEPEPAGRPLYRVGGGIKRW
jgi:hypothetical protein